MADFSNGIRNIGPSYPVRPVQPIPKDRATDNDRKKREQPPERQPDDDDEPRHIDEHV